MIKSAPRTNLNWYNLARISAVILLAIVVTYILSALVPYYANGVAWQPVNLVSGGTFDPKGLAPFNWSVVGFVWSMAAILSMIGVSFIVPVYSILLGGATLLAWKTLAQKQKFELLFVLGLSLLLATGVWTFYRIVQTWLAD